MQLCKTKKIKSLKLFWTKNKSDFQLKEKTATKLGTETSYKKSYLANGRLILGKRTH